MSNIENYATDKLMTNVHTLLTISTPRNHKNLKT